MAGGVLLLSVMDAVSKYAVGQMATLPLLALRSAAVLLLLAPFVARAGGRAALRTRRPGGHLLRAALAVCSMTCFFEGLRTMPLATAITICFAAPLFMTLLSVPILGERVDVHRWAAVGVGFLGVCVVAGPAAADAELGRGTWLLLGAAVFYAASMTCVRWLASTESDLAMMVWQNALVFAVAGASLLFVPVQVPGSMWGVILVMAVMLVAGQRAIFMGLRLAPVAAVAPFHYTELVWSALFGWIFWREWPEAHVWWGATLIIGAGMFSIALEHRRPAAAAPTSAQ